MIGSLALRQRPAEVAPAARPRLITPTFLALAAASLAYFTADGILLPALPLYVTGPLGDGNVAVGLSVGAFSISAFLLRPWAGRLADRRGRRLLVLSGAAVFVVSVVGYLAAASTPMLVGLRLLTGVGEALFFVGAFAAIADLAPPERRGEAMSLFSLSLYVGIGVGPFLGEALLSAAGFGAAWFGAAALGTVALVLGFRLPALRPPAGNRPHRLVDPRGVLPGIVMLASIWGMAGFLAFVPIYALDVGMAASGPVLGLFAGVVVAVRSIGARIPDRLGHGRAIRIALAASAAGLVVIGTVHSPGGLLAGAVVFGLGIALFTPSLMALAVDGIPPAERGSVLGTTSAFLDLAFGLGPASLGFAAAAIGREGTFVAGGAVALVGLAIVVVTGLGRPRSRIRA